MDAKERLGRFKELKEGEDILIGTIEKIIRADRFDRKRGGEAISKVKAAIQILSCDLDESKKLSEHQMRVLVSLIEELGRKGRRRIFLEVKDDESGIVELITGKEFLFEDNGNKSRT